MSSHTSRIVEISTSIGSHQEAELLANHLVEQNLAACVQIYGPINSIYRWQGEIRQDLEWKLVGKTAWHLVDDTIECIRQKHPYETPEILCIPVLRAADGYENWLAESVRS